MVDHPSFEIEDERDPMEIACISLVHWKLQFDGSSTQNSTKVGVILESCKGWNTQFSFQLDFKYSNNQAMYEALFIGLKYLKDMGMSNGEIIGYSFLGLNQLSTKYQCLSFSLVPYYAATDQLLKSFNDVVLHHIQKELNTDANEIAQIASGVRFPGKLQEMIININIKKHFFSSLFERGMRGDIFCIQLVEKDWRYSLIKYLNDPNGNSDKKIQLRVVNYVLFYKKLYKKSKNDLLLKCLGAYDDMLVMAEVHKGISGTH